MNFLLFLSTLPLLFAAKNDFNDDFSRNVMFPLAAATYTHKPQPCLDNKMKGAKISIQVEVPCDNIVTDTCSGFTMIDTTRGVIGLAFRGTNTGDQLKAEIIETLFINKTEFRDGGMTSVYFAEAFEDLWFNSGLGADFLYLANKYPSYKLYITGHSLGGSLASLASIHILKNNLFPKTQTVYYNYGEPRTGDQEFADLLDNLIESWRVIHDKDIIPHVPFLSMDYAHHKYEVWYNNDMTPGSLFEICDKFGRRDCSEKTGTNLVFNPDHIVYYNHDLSKYGKNGCVDE